MQGWCSRCQKLTQLRVSRNEGQIEGKNIVNVTTACSKCNLTLSSEIREAGNKVEVLNQ